MKQAPLGVAPPRRGFDRGRERAYYCLLLAAWLFLLGLNGSRIATAFGLINDRENGIGEFIVMVLSPVVLLFGLLTVGATLAALLIGSWPLRLRVMLWFAVLYFFGSLAEAQSLFAERTRATIGALGLSLLLGLAIYWTCRPVARKEE